MSILGKFFGKGEARGKYGAYAGRIEHRSDNVAYVYDEWGNFNGRIESYGNNVTIFDKNGNMVEGGGYNEGSNKLDTYSYTGGSMKRYNDVGDTSVSYDNSGYSSSYVSEDDDKPWSFFEDEANKPWSFFDD